jgi:hypothetical protein
VKRLCLAAALAACLISYVNAATLPVSVRSPDGKIVVTIAQNGVGQLTYAIQRKNEVVIAPSALRVTLQETSIGPGSNGPSNGLPIAATRNTSSCSRGTATCRSFAVPCRDVSAIECHAPSDFTSTAPSLANA